MLNKIIIVLLFIAVFIIGYCLGIGAISYNDSAFILSCYGSTLVMALKD